MSTKTTTEKQRAYAKSSSAASSTSVYTTEEKKDHYSTLEEVLESKCSDPLVRQVIQDLMQVCATITEALRVALVTVEGTTNEFGDSQLSVDVSSRSIESVDHDKYADRFVC
jgi:sedoheptulose-bisphosphatase